MILIYTCFLFILEMIENRREEVEEEIKAMESRFEGDIKAIDEGKFNHKSTKEEFDDEDMDHGYYNNSDGENDQQIQQSEKNVVNDHSDDDCIKAGEFHIHFTSISLILSLLTF